MTARECIPWIIPVAVFSALDVLTTLIILALGGYEANPMMAPFVVNLSWLIIAKGLFILIIFGLAYWAEKYYRHLGWMVIGTASFITCLVVVQNIGVLSANLYIV